MHTVRAAAELALSVLPHSHALNYNEIQRAVLQCKEQSDAMLERACLTVEAAAKGNLNPIHVLTLYNEIQRTVLQCKEQSDAMLERACLTVEAAAKGNLNPIHGLTLYNEIQRTVLQCKEQSDAMLERACLTVEAAAKGNLNPIHGLTLYNEIQRAVLQCKEQSDAMLERACLSVEAAAKGNLNPIHGLTLYNEIQRAVLQCKEQSDAMLERACLTVEAAAKGNLNPIHGLTLYNEIQRAVLQCKEQSDAMLERACLTVEAAAKGSLNPIHTYGGPSGPPPQFALPQYFVRGLVAPPGHVQPQQVCNQQVTHAQVAHAQVAHAQVTHAHAPQVHVPPCVSHPPPPMPVNVSVHNAQVNVNIGAVSNVGVTGLGGSAPPNLPPGQLRRLLAAYRVGMLALETQARRVHDDRPQNKFGRNPPYGEHVKWLLRVCKRLGAQYLHQFCVCAVNSVVSPFVLYELCVESAHWLARGGPHQLVMQHLRGTLAPLVQKCQQIVITRCDITSIVSPFVLYELCVQSAYWLARGGPHQLVMQHLRGTLAPLVQKCQQIVITRCDVNSVVSPFVLCELCVQFAHWLARGGPHQLVMQHL
ncbi:Zinc finger SWIM domain-containing protein [Operophtera brumata]|uniref:Zinc finger SWIM domain-containing protein n=1 Tax=Operophtera brumata TaxID=104452 RepID=A0A0L7LKD7_OPEBR|nr:Zinc finger SWIM domain-containing protein [Operophtera brumata]